MQADVQKKREPGADFFQKLFADRPRHGIERNDRIASAPSGSTGLDSAFPGLSCCGPTSAFLALFLGVGFRRRRVHRRTGQTWPIGMAPSSTKVLPPTLTARARGFSREPEQSGQVMLRMNGSSWLRTGPPVAPRYLAKQIVRDAGPLLGMRPDLAAIPPAVDNLAIAGSIKPRPPPFVFEVAPRALEHRPFGRTIGVGLQVGGDTLRKDAVATAPFP